MKNPNKPQMSQHHPSVHHSSEYHPSEHHPSEHHPSEYYLSKHHPSKHHSRNHGEIRANVALWLAVFLLFQPVSALAYLDPSTGSMIISAIVGLIASLVLAIKTYWYRLKSFFKGRKPAVGSKKADSDKEVGSDRDNSSKDSSV